MQRDRLKDSVRGAFEILKMLCDRNSFHRSEYLEHAPCYRKLAPDFEGRWDWGGVLVIGLVFQNVRENYGLCPRISRLLPTKCAGEWLGLVCEKPFGFLV